MNKLASLLLVVILTISSLIAVKAAQASLTKPSVPYFTLKFVDRSYDVPPTYSIDPYTGENITHLGDHVKRVTLEMTIENQLFTPYYDADSGWNISFCYNIRIKGYYSGDWIELYRPSDGYPIQSDSEYTVISLGTLGGNGLSLATNAKMIDVPSGGKVDFQVEAMIGYVSRVYNPNATGQLLMFPWQFTGEKSGWSETQTITIDGSTFITTPSVSPSQNSTATPDQPIDQSQNTTPSSTDQPDTQNAASSSLNWEQLAILILSGAVILLSAVIVYSRRRSAKRT